VTDFTPINELPRDATIQTKTTTLDTFKEASIRRRRPYTEKDRFRPLGGEVER